MSSMWVAEVPRQEESFLFTVGSGAAAVIVTKVAKKSRVNPPKIGGSWGVKDECSVCCSDTISGYTIQYQIL